MFDFRTGHGMNYIDIVGTNNNCYASTACGDYSTSNRYLYKFVVGCVTLNCFFIKLNIVLDEINFHCELLV